MKERAKFCGAELEIWAGALLAASAVLLLCPSQASAVGMGGSIPQITFFAQQIAGTITGPVAMTIFMAGVVKAGQNVYKQGGIQGLADGGLGIAGAGALLGGASWLAAQFGVSGALLQ